MLLFRDIAQFIKNRWGNPAYIIQKKKVVGRFEGEFVQCHSTITCCELKRNQRMCENCSKVRKIIYDAWKNALNQDRCKHSPLRYLNLPSVSNVFIILITKIYLRMQ